MKDVLTVLLIFVSIIFIGKGIKTYDVNAITTITSKPTIIDQEIEDWQPFSQN